MKQAKFFLLILASIVAVGCGPQMQNPNALNMGWGGGTQAGWNNPWGGGFNNGMGWNNPFMNPWNSAGQPIYNGTQVVGYRAQRPLMSGVIGPLSNPMFSQSVTVPAGSRVFVNISQIRYGADIFCDRRLVDVYRREWSNTPITNMVISVNNQPVGGGNGGRIDVPSGGTLTLSADLSANAGLRCGWGGDRPFRVINYYVQVGQGVSLESCTNLQGQQMPCP